MFDIKKILVPIDFADCSKKGLETALELAEKVGASVDVIHVWLTPAYVSPAIAVSLGNGRTEALEEIARRESTLQLAEFMEKVKKPANVSINTDIIFGLPHEVILARANKYDAIVMGTHGRKGFAHFFVGSVTEKVMRESPCPVLVVRATAR